MPDDDAFAFIRTERGNWSDLQIASAFAYADIFVTHDGNLRQRLKLLRRHKQCFFEALTLAKALSIG